MITNSKRISDVLPDNTPEWFRKIQAEFDEHTSSINRNGNAFKLLINGVESWPCREKNLEDADAVFVKTCYFDDDAAGTDFLDRLMKKATNGIPVFVQYDVKASEHSKLKVFKDGLLKYYKLPERFQRLQNAGGVPIPVNSGDWHFFTRKDHEKYLLTYHKGQPMRFIGGGMNIGDRYKYGGDPTHPVDGVGYGYRDTDYEVQGPMVNEALQEFIDDAYRALLQNKRLAKSGPAYTDADHEKLLDYVENTVRKDSESFRNIADVSIRFIDNEPDEGSAGQYITKADLICLKNISGGETVTIAVPYYLPTDEFFEGLKCAAIDNGVKIRLMVNSQQTDETKISAWAARSYHRELYRICPKGSVEIYEWMRAPEDGFGPTHQKSIQYGAGGPFSTSSANLDYHSLRHNSEGASLVWNPEAAQKFADMLDKDFNRSNVRLIEQDELENESWYKKFGQWRARQRLRYFL
jgi:phosphatidylserine/phosphatidylglycerophosphate/cardiolipin synthase-like enzyme